MMQKTVIYVDVDETFVRSAGTKRIPMTSVIHHIRGLKEQGAVLYCWSSGGANYARQSAEEFGIADCFVDFLPKPNAILDDQNVSEWRYFRQVHPAECEGMTLGDYNARSGREISRPDNRFTGQSSTRSRGSASKWEHSAMLHMNISRRLVSWCRAGVGVAVAAILWQTIFVAHVSHNEVEKHDGIVTMSLVGALQEQSRGAILVDVESQPQNLKIPYSISLHDASAAASRGHALILLGGESQWKVWSLNRRVAGAVPSRLLRRATGLNAHDEVSPAWLQTQWLARRIRVLDLREPDEWVQSHLKNSEQVSMFDVDKRLRRDEPVALLCLTGHRSAWALKQLRAKGFLHVVSVRGGWLEWKAQNRPLLEKNAASSTRYE